MLSLVGVRVGVGRDDVRVGGLESAGTKGGVEGVRRRRKGNWMGILWTTLCLREVDAARDGGCGRSVGRRGWAEEIAGARAYVVVVA